MFINLPGFTYKQYLDEQGDTREMVYDTLFEIDVDQIESITPSTGPDQKPGQLNYSRLISKSGRYYDINLPFKELQTRVHKAKQDIMYQKLIIFSN